MATVRGSSKPGVHEEIQVTVHGQRKPAAICVFKVKPTTICGKVKPADGHTFSPGITDGI